MIRYDGDFVIYVLRAKDKKDWFNPSYDHFGAPLGFSASGKCWQETGIHGTFDKQEGIDAVSAMLAKYPDHDWKLCEVSISQSHRDICTFNRLIKS